MEFRQVQHFLAVAAEGNFHRAAAKVHLTQQAVSKSVAQLESKLGVRLFDRDRQSVGLTAFGRLLLPHARTIAAEARQFDEGLAALLGTRTGSLRVGATPTTISRLLPTALRLLLRRRPKLRVAIEHGDYDRLSSLLLQGQLDAVLSTEPPPPWDPLIHIEALCTDANVVAARPNHPMVKKLKLRALADYPWLALTNFAKAEQDTRALFGAAGIKPPAPAMTTSSVAFALAWLEDSDFLCVMPRQLIARELAEGRLAALDVRIRPGSWPLVLATRRHATRSPATLAFIESAREAGASVR
jgi:DNA-binding transcriptional LysR family regulator